ncbi:hypothetical protein VTO42DRAFT_1798 [Malbranchea cinnamomea]
MSAALPYLRNLRKSDLLALAEVSDLKDYQDYKKTELEAALDEHLSANKATLSKEPKLSEYYRRLALPPRSSPIKKEPKDTISLGGEELRKSTRSRRVTRQTEEINASDESSEGVSQASRSPPPANETPARRTFAFPSLPPSPAVVTEAIDRQTTRVRKSVSEAWDASGVSERTSELRSYLSSVSTIQGLIILLELYGLTHELVPFRYLTTVPAIESLNTPPVPIKIPDLFVLLSGSFWSPFSLWLVTSLVLPSTSAYFFNLSLKVSQQPGSQASHTYGTRRAAASKQALSRSADFDPLVFNVSKALIAYLVYANSFTFWNVFSTAALHRVIGAVPGGLPGLLTSSAVCALGSLYEAILKK